MQATHYEFNSIKTAEIWREKQIQLGHTVSAVWFDPKTGRVQETRDPDSCTCLITKLH